MAQGQRSAWTNPETEHAFSALSHQPDEVGIPIEFISASALSPAELGQNVRYTLARLVVGNEELGLSSGHLSRWMSQVQDWGKVDWHQIGERFWERRAMDKRSLRGEKLAKLLDGATRG